MARDFYGKVLDGLMESVEFKSMFRAELTGLFQTPEFRSIFRAEMTSFCQSPQFKEIIRAEVQAAMMGMSLTPEVEKLDGISNDDKLKGKCQVDENMTVELGQMTGINASIDEMILWKIGSSAKNLDEPNLETTPEISLSPVQDPNIPASIIDMDIVAIPEGVSPNLRAIPDAVFDKWAAGINSVPNEEQKTPRGPQPLSVCFAKCRRLGLLQSLKIFTPCAKEDVSRFCTYHVEMGHHTNDCRKLRKEIITLIKEGKLEGLAIEDVQNDKRKKMKN